MYPPAATIHVTFYILHQDKETGLFSCERAVLKNVGWQEVSVTVAQNTGQNAVDRVNIQVPMYREQTGRDYIAPSEWYKLSTDEIHDYWTVDTGLAMNIDGQGGISPIDMTRFLRGVVDYEFTPGDVRCIKEQMVAFDKQYRDSVRVTPSRGDVNVRDDVWPLSLRDVLIGAS